MFLLLWVGCLIPYKLISYEISSLPDTYLTAPENNKLYCELGFAYAEGFDIEDAKQNLYQPIREGRASAIVDLEYGIKALTQFYADDRKHPVNTIFWASGVLVTWGPCR